MRCPKCGQKFQSETDNLCPGCRQTPIEYDDFESPVDLSSFDEPELWQLADDLTSDAIQPSGTESPDTDSSPDEPQDSPVAFDTPGFEPVLEDGGTDHAEQDDLTPFPLHDRPEDGSEENPVAFDAPEFEPVIGGTDTETVDTDGIIPPDTAPVIEGMPEEAATGDTMEALAESLVDFDIPEYEPVIEGFDTETVDTDGTALSDIPPVIDDIREDTVTGDTLEALADSPIDFDTTEFEPVIEGFDAEAFDTDDTEGTSSSIDSPLVIEDEPEEPVPEDPTVLSPAMPSDLDTEDFAHIIEEIDAEAGATDEIVPPDTAPVIDDAPEDAVTDETAEVSPDDLIDFDTTEFEPVIEGFDVETIETDGTDPSEMVPVIEDLPEAGGRRRHRYLSAPVVWAAIAISGLIIAAIWTTYRTSPVDRDRPVAVVMHPLPKPPASVSPKSREVDAVPGAAVEETHGEKDVSLTLEPAVEIIRPLPETAGKTVDDTFDLTPTEISVSMEKIDFQLPPEEPAAQGADPEESLQAADAAGKQEAVAKAGPGIDRTASTAPPEKGKSGSGGGEYETGEPFFTLQAESLRNTAFAQQYLDRLKAKDYPAYRVETTTPSGRRYHKIRVGRYPTRPAAEKAAAAFTHHENKDVIIVLSKRPEAGKAVPSGQEALPGMIPDRSDSPFDGRPVPVPGPVDFCYEAVEKEAAYFTIQLCSLSNKALAVKHLDTLRREGYPAYVVVKKLPGGTPRYKVRVGKFANRIQAGKTAENLRRSGETSCLVLLSQFDISL